MKKMLIAFGALLTVSVLPIAHADGYWNYDYGNNYSWNQDNGNDGDNRTWQDTQHIRQDQNEMQQAYQKRAQDIREYWIDRNNGDWDAMQQEQAEISRDNVRIAHEQREVRHYRWDRWQAADHDWD